MRWLLVGMLAVTLGLSVGCQRDRKKEMAQVPTVTSVRTDGTYAANPTPDYTYASATAAASGSPTPSTNTYGGNQYITLPSEPVPGTGVTVGHGAASTYTAGASYSANPATTTPSYSTATPSYSTTTYTSSDRIEAPGANSEPVFLGPTAAAPAPPATTTVTTLSATPAAPAVPAATPATGGTSYTVARGDTLWSIAQKHYGDGKRWQDIASANGISDARKLAVGQKIVLP